ncbi:MAG: hypothetical protein ACK5XN_08040, partial [Bacteroidota bacterium]
QKSVTSRPSLRSLRETVIKKGSHRARKEENTQSPQRSLRRMSLRSLRAIRIQSKAGNFKLY